MKTKRNFEIEYNESVETYKNAIKAWQNVKRLTKKDGTDFANINKNFSNARIIQEYKWVKPSLRVDYPYSHGYTYDNIEIDDNDTIDNVFKKINDRVVYYDGVIKNLEQKKQNVNYVFDEVDKTMKQLIKFCKDNGFNSYEVCHYISDNCYRLGD